MLTLPFVSNFSTLQRPKEKDYCKIFSLRRFYLGSEQFALNYCFTDYFSMRSQKYSYILEGRKKAYTLFFYKNRNFSVEVWTFLMLIHIFSNFHSTPIPNICLKCLSSYKLSLGKFACPKIDLVIFFGKFYKKGRFFMRTVGYSKHVNTIHVYFTDFLISNGFVSSNLKYTPDTQHRLTKSQNQ